ncbi:MAG TPA: AMED_5909 family protein [Pseudonocardiaceae bacterium]|nr:AMED_5909 family protein [Pseudonocardiaceae bacterium]
MRTLKAAHEAVHRLRPKLDAPLSEWLAFRQTSAALYTQVADVDRFHHHEALYWAQREQETANNIAAQIRAAKSQERSRPNTERR